MIEFVFTIDYEIYGNGEGTLAKSVLEPAERLRSVFDKRNSRFVVFADVAELELIETNGTDQAIELVKCQLKDLHREGFEIGLHIHPWWYNAQYENGGWILDQTEYNFCTQPLERIRKIVDRSIAYLRNILASPDFTPTSFRAGHLLFQPTQPLGDVLAERGVWLDSSVYKGGLWRKYNLDYRRAPRNAYYWKFNKEVIIPDPQGHLLEIPIYTRQAPFWRLLTSKRVGLQHTGGSAKQTGKRIINRFSDFMRFRYPHKLDLGQMNKAEMIRMIDRIIREDKKNPLIFRPIVAIMHTKDPIDYDAIECVLDILEKARVRISTFNETYARIKALEAR
ncbi:MAG: hypothetical protein IMZ61_12480 [Planctomycetes bacterium]|nr:hypothetical protein [Planctomycetota bacterium]